ncbi:hypothetical protein BV494_06805 [Rahnella sikkimica]|uniref:Uncharacterized protein n=1 Tax=Rahnella sikkimica TaxID=1805933 RepID=A0A2L1UNZ9_9GAMM|nr:hypothetical protein BV494_06805 [Rahnella sikkimica]
MIFANKPLTCKQYKYLFIDIIFFKSWNIHHFNEYDFYVLIFSSAFQLCRCFFLNKIFYSTRKYTFACINYILFQYAKKIRNFIFILLFH